jgi:hypothetical protein
MASRGHAEANADPQVAQMQQQEMQQLQVQIQQIMAAAPPPIQSAVYARTPALKNPTSLLNFDKKADFSIYTQGKSPMFEGDKCFEARSKQLMPFIEALAKRALDMGWSDVGNAQPIARVNIVVGGVNTPINVITNYGCITMTELQLECAPFMTGADADQQVAQNNQMIHECI